MPGMGGFEFASFYSPGSVQPHSADHYLSFLRSLSLLAHLHCLFILLMRAIVRDYIAFPFQKPQ